LKGQEIRFLRKRLGKKSVDFARLLRIEAESLSRIENEKQPVSGQVETLTRVAYIASADDCECAQARARLIELLEGELAKRKSRIIMMKVSSNNEWKQAA
jgi:transcriptional regulator with XRE-family HTH domain